MCKYNPKIDLVFRKLFGSEENKDILISFINGVLEGNMVIKDVTIKNPYNLSTYLSGKTSILDVKAVDENGIWYDIEMQMNDQTFYGKRALYYWSKVYTDQIDKAEEYRELEKTIGIHLLNFDYFKDDRYFRRVTLKDYETNEIYKKLDYADLYFIEMGKFHKDISEVKTLLEKWVTFLNEAYSLEKGNIPESLNEKEIEKAVEQLEIMYFDKDEREIYEAERKIRMDTKEEMATAREKGLAKGIKEGLKQGIE